MSCVPLCLESYSLSGLALLGLLFGLIVIVILSANSGQSHKIFSSSIKAFSFLRIRVNEQSFQMVMFLCSRR